MILGPYRRLCSISSFMNSKYVFYIFFDEVFSIIKKGEDCWTISVSNVFKHRLDFDDNKHFICLMSLLR